VIGSGLDLRHLEIFARVVQEGGITQAAKSLGLTQPTVSGHIRSLETEAGAVLLHRGGGRAKPTAAGELLWRYARQICEQKAQAQAELDRFLGLHQGDLKIGASTTPATYFLPPFLATFARAHPAIRVELLIGDSREILEAVELGKVELAVVGDDVDPDRYRAVKVATDRIVLAVGRAHPWFARATVKLAELAGQALVVRGEGSATLSTVDHALEAAGLKFGRDLKVALRLPTNEAIREAVARGDAAAFLPLCCLAGRDRELKALEVTGLAVQRAFTAVQALSREPGPAARELLAQWTTAKR
jgi:DNA-binding transcriptional LysR family regulator